MGHIKKNQNKKRMLQRRLESDKEGQMIKTLNTSYNESDSK